MPDQSITIHPRYAYEKQIAATRDERMRWWRHARFGMFIHYGLYSQIGRKEWAMAMENIPAREYVNLARSFDPKPGCAREWVELAQRAGMKYAVLTTRHHEGFSLWDSKVNPYNSVNLGPKRDLVAEFVEACRDLGLRIGFYSSLMDWHHPDSWRCVIDEQARRRFNQYIEALNTELLTNYGHIDILWYDVPLPLTTYEGWNSLAMNQRLRALQPHIIINNRSRLNEDFGTPEGHVSPEGRDWEACMTFNDISWGYVDSEQAKPYSYNAPRILKMLHTCALGGGNLLLNIGPAPDGSVPAEAVQPLKTVGDWLADHGEAVYGLMDQGKNRDHELTGGGLADFRGNGVCLATKKGNTIYLWCLIWPPEGSMAIGGYLNSPTSVRLLRDSQPLKFEYRDQRILIRDMPADAADPHANVTVIAMDFDEPPRYQFASYYPQLRCGHDYSQGLNPPVNELTG